jgi:cobalt-precorrin-6B (C15)-methyltransferase
MLIKDEEFIRGNCPMTKEEIRTVSISKLNIEKGDRLLDIGAGTGSISIQMSKLTETGEVIAIEKDEEALEIIEKNKEKFNADNLKVVKGEALLKVEEIKGEFDGIFVGGSSGNIESIIEKYGQKLKCGKYMVLNFITIDNVYKAIRVLEALNYETELIQLSISKSKGKSHMLLALNPIFIITARRVKHE